MKVAKRRLPLLLAVLAVCLASGLQAQNPVPSAPRSASPRTAQSATGATAPTSDQPAPVSGAAPQIIAAGGDYVLAPSDTVEMTVFHEPDLSTQTKIGSDGSAQFPLIGEIKIAGLAMRDAREAIRRKYNADYLVEPQVYLNVIGYAGRKFTILGQVAKPGTYDFPPGQHLTLMEAVGMAGGFTRLANRSKVEIKRTAKSSEQIIKVNTKVLSDRDGKPVELVSGDVVTVNETFF